MRLLAILLTFLLAGCQLAPIYAGGSQGVANSMLAAVDVAPIPEKTGFLVRDRLLSRLHSTAGATEPRYLLEVALDDQIDGFGVRGDNSIVRERRTLRARYRLRELATDKILLDTIASADAGIDVVQSEYAVVAAEQSAVARLAENIADQIVARLALLSHQPG